MVMDRHKSHSLALSYSWPYHNFLLAKFLSSCASCWRPTKHIISDYHFKIKGNIFQNDHFCLPFAKAFYGRRRRSYTLRMHVPNHHLFRADCCTSNNLPNKSTQQNRQRTNESNGEWKIDTRRIQQHLATWLLGAVQLRAMALMCVATVNLLCWTETVGYYSCYSSLWQRSGAKKVFSSGKTIKMIFIEQRERWQCGTMRAQRTLPFWYFSFNLFTADIDQMWTKIGNQ